MRRALGQLGYIAQTSLILPFHYHGIQHAEVNSCGNAKMTLPVICTTACALAGGRAEEALMHVTCCAKLKTCEMLKWATRNTTKLVTTESRRGSAVNKLLQINSDRCQQLLTVTAIACPASRQAVGPRGPIGKARARPFLSGAQGRRARVVPRLPTKL